MVCFFILRIYFEWLVGHWIDYLALFQGTSCNKYNVEELISSGTTFIMLNFSLRTISAHKKHLCGLGNPVLK